MAGLFDIGDSEDEKRQSLGLLGLMTGLGIMQANQPGSSMGQAVGAGGLQGIQGLMQMQQLQQRAQQAKAMQQLSQQRVVPNTVREYEYAKQNGYEGSFEDYKGTVAGRNETPSNIREWEAFNKLPPEDQARYLTMKRANPTVNLGGQVITPNQAFPSAAPLASYAKTPPPEQMPEFKGQQALESTRGTSAGNREATAETKGVNATNTLSILDGVEDLIDKSTGSMAGAGRDAVLGAVGVATSGAEANSKLKVLQASLMTTMPRMEGPQSDRDVQLYREAAGQIGDPMVPAGRKKAAVEMIRGLQRKYKEAAPSAKAPGASGGWSIQRVD